jgi:serine/threonine-protein kinase
MTDHEHQPFTDFALIKALTGKVLGGTYQLDRFIGAGRTFLVFAATDVFSRTQVALKLVRPDRVQEPDLVDRVRHFTERAAALHHEHLAEVLGFHQADTFSFVVMELLPQETLAALAARAQGRRVELPVLLPILRQLAEALDTLHDSGMRHGGLRPDLVFLCHRGAEPHFVKLTGLGASPPPPYTAPEQARGEEVSGRTDQFALAALVYELLTGQRAFARRDDEPSSLVLERVLSQDPPPFNLPDRIDAALRKALNRSATWRFNSIQEFVRALEGEATLYLPGPPVPLPPKKKQRQVSALLIGALLLLGALAGTGYLLHRGAAARQKPPTPAPAKPQPTPPPTLAPAKPPAPPQPPPAPPQPPLTAAQPQAPQLPPPRPVAPVRTPPGKPPRPAAPQLSFKPDPGGLLKQQLSACLAKVALPETYTLHLAREDYLVPDSDAPAPALRRDFRECLKALGDKGVPARLTIRRGTSR